MSIEMIRFFKFSKQKTTCEIILFQYSLPLRLQTVLLGY